MFSDAKETRPPNLAASLSSQGGMWASWRGVWEEGWRVGSRLRASTGPVSAAACGRAAWQSNQKERRGGGGVWMFSGVGQHGVPEHLRVWEKEQAAEGLDEAALCPVIGPFHLFLRSTSEGLGFFY